MMARRALLAALLALLVLPAAARAVSVDYSVSGAQGANGWYVGPVTVRWTVSADATSASGCDPVISLKSDTRGTKLTCIASTDADQASRSVTIKIDQTPPTVTAVAPDRPPDAPGWYRAPVTVGWTGSDATSGIGSCTRTTYAGPDGPATLQGTCTDAAGNTSAPAAFGLGYDSTAPKLAAVSARAGDALVTVRWRATGAAAVTVTRTRAARGALARTVYSGPGRRLVDSGLRNGVGYRYTITATDVAGNVAVAAARATPHSRLLAPGPGARVRRAPVLRWRRIAGARYYNVQLYRGKSKVLSAWPATARLPLAGAWRYAGRLQRLRPGRYRWFVWAGYGPRAARRYGRLLGARAFTVRR